MLMRAIMDVVFPRACSGCGAAVGGEALYLCWNCLAALPIIRPPFCRICGDPIDGVADGDFACPACIRRPPHFDLARSAARYRGGSRDILQDFKYHGAVWLARDLNALLLACFRTHFSELAIDAIGWVPLYPARERERSYNQSRLLAWELAASLRLPELPPVLRRVRPTPTQTHLTVSERTANVRGAFAIKNPSAVSGVRLLLIDDVMTTGATVNECARVLKAAGADKVHVLTVARG